MNSFEIVFEMSANDARKTVLMIFYDHDIQNTKGDSFMLGQPCQKTIKIRVGPRAKSNVTSEMKSSIGLFCRCSEMSAYITLHLISKVAKLT